MIPDASWSDAWPNHIARSLGSTPIHRVLKSTGIINRQQADKRKRTLWTSLIMLSKSIGGMAERTKSMTTMSTEWTGVSLVSEALVTSWTWTEHRELNATNAADRFMIRMASELKSHAIPRTFGNASKIGKIQLPWPQPNSNKTLSPFEWFNCSSSWNSFKTYFRGLYARPNGMI